MLQHCLIIFKQLISHEHVQVTANTMIGYFFETLKTIIVSVHYNVLVDFVRNESYYDGKAQTL